MSPFDRAVLAERAAALERHLARVAHKLPADVDGLAASTDASDAVILHLWQATQIVIDLAVAACVARGAGTPQSDAIPSAVCRTRARLTPRWPTGSSGAAGFRNVVGHAYEALDMARVHLAARTGPADLRAFVAALARPETR